MHVNHTVMVRRLFLFFAWKLVSCKIVSGQNGEEREILFSLTADVKSYIKTCRVVEGVKQMPVVESENSGRCLNKKTSGQKSVEPSAGPGTRIDGC